ncbi:MAG TPA: hypothetical protein VGH28_10800 [Polyangiaceae bacterium]|jgi:hypothetical protein
MRSLVLVIVALAACGGQIGPYEVTTDSGVCTLYTPTSSGYCNLSPCDAGANDASPASDLTNTAIVKCGDSP